MRRYRYRGRRRADATRGVWPPMVDPWAGAPLFDVALERQRVAREIGGRR